MTFLTHTSLRNVSFITFKIIPKRVSSVMYLKWIHQWVQLWSSYTKEHNTKKWEGKNSFTLSLNFLHLFNIFFPSCNVYFLRTLPSPLPLNFILFLIARFSPLLCYCCVRWTKAFFCSTELIASPQECQKSAGSWKNKHPVPVFLQIETGGDNISKNNYTYPSWWKHSWHKK